MQLIRSLPVTAAAYIANAFHSRITSPSRCPLCKSPDCESLGYYSRHITIDRRAVPILIRRFRCRQCGRTTSILPSFAQPYRLVQNAAIDAYFETGRDDPPTPWGTILRGYYRRFTRWLPELRRTVSVAFDRAPPFDTPPEAWRALRRALGNLESITEFLVSQFQITPFGRYRCHALPV